MFVGGVFVFVYTSISLCVRDSVHVQGGGEDRSVLVCASACPLVYVDTVEMAF